MNAAMKDIVQHLQAARFAEAAAGCREVLKGKPRDANALHFLGLAEWQLGGKADRAIGLIEKAIQQSPGQAAMHHNLAAVLGGAGRLADAEASFIKAINLKPDYAEAYYNLSGVKKFADSDGEITGMKQLYASSGLSPADREFLCYGLAKAHDDLGAYEEAFHFALEGSRLKDVQFDVTRFEADVELLKSEISADVLRPRPGRGNASQAPVFIVGMPRSGTTLVEQILSRHSAVFGAGELPTIGSFHGAMRKAAGTHWGYKGRDYGFWKLIPDDAINPAAQGLLDFIAKRAGGAPDRFTDKMPSNVFFLGLIAMMFPNARIVHLRRHPLDTCVSCFFQRFSNGQHFTFQLDWLGRYYRGYVAAMDHWRKVLPLEMLEVNYEDLVGDTDAEARKLVAFAGLEWEEACGDPSAAAREVKTASRWQVRQPVYQTSVERWRRYEAYLGPLVDALGGMKWIEAHHKSG